MSARYADEPLQTHPAERRSELEKEAAAAENA
jgi:hypothetical protein